jgi:hypothetical protein
VEFYNAANRLYVLHFIEVAEMGSHHVFYFWLNLAKGKRGGVFDKEMGRMIVAVLAQYLEEHPDDLLCYCHYDNDTTLAIDRIFHLWARSNHDVMDGRATFFDGAGHHTEGFGLHFMVIHHLHCKDITELKSYILENSDVFATCIREQVDLFLNIEKQIHESDNAVC